VAERRSVAADVVGSNPTSRPNPFPAVAHAAFRVECALSPIARETTLPRSPKAIAVAATSLVPSPENLFIGTSGWAYPTWKPGFYPKDVPSRAFLHFYAAHLTSVEVNYTFRTLPTAAQLQGWLDATPPGFRFSFKAPQRITHFQRLRNSLEPNNNSHATLTEFLASITPAKAANKLGPILFQLPPNFSADNARLNTFLEDPAFTERPSLQLAFEFRHPSWFSEATYDVLRRHNTALCIAEGDDLITPDIDTASFRCYRLRRTGGYSPAEIKAFAKRFTKSATAADVYAYFMHEDEPTGALNATALLSAAAESTATKPKAGAPK
jgi:uncharacterized protein YecE (DUF72 family)